jgi:hypothetical protein
MHDNGLINTPIISSLFTTTNKPRTQQKHRVKYRLLRQNSTNIKFVELDVWEIKGQINSKWRWGVCWVIFAKEMVTRRLQILGFIRGK